MSIIFTKEMKKDYTLLIPNMSPIHFEIMKKPFAIHGFKCLLLTNDSSDVISEGLKYVHNDMCYPALLVIGQMIDAIKKGLVDDKKCALVITQTGGGCRASNYYFLLIKALERAGYSHIPVISLNLKGMNQHEGFDLTPIMVIQAFAALLYGDLLMLLSHQVRPYEVNKGETDKLIESWTLKIGNLFEKNKGYWGRNMKRNFFEITESFHNIKVNRTPKVKVGIVGEIYMKYSPLGNSNLEKFLEDEGCEVMLPPMLTFLLYGFSNGINDNTYYGGKKLYSWLMSRILIPFIGNFEKLIVKAMTKYPEFIAPANLHELIEFREGIIDVGVKMGEGWLLTAEMIELIEKGYKNIVCTQPFGCLPNHIVGKAMIRPLKEKYPDSNIVPIDYDPSATKVNQENRIKLMLSVAKEELEKLN